MKEIEEEEQKLRKLQKIVDGTCVLLKRYPMSEEKAWEFVEGVKAKVLELFPENEQQFELIYRPRFERIIEERKGKET